MEPEPFKVLDHCNLIRLYPPRERAVNAGGVLSAPDPELADLLVGGVPEDALGVEEPRAVVEAGTAAPIDTEETPWVVPPEDRDGLVRLVQVGRVHAAAPLQCVNVHLGGGGGGGAGAGVRG